MLISSTATLPFISKFFIFLEPLIENCICNNGYNNVNNNTLNVCLDINECEQDFCGFGNCSNTDGSFTCMCPPQFLPGEEKQQCQECVFGFEFGNQSESCQDIDECSQININCGDGICENNIGSYSCVCFDGYFNFETDSSSICGNY